jgi:hypothetical protein
MCAIEDNTTLSIIDCDSATVFRVVLNVGDVLIVRGDVLHYGDAYACDNTRLHFYFDVVGRGEGVRTVGVSFFTSDVKNLKRYRVVQINDVRKNETLTVNIVSRRLKKKRKAECAVEICLETKGILCIVVIMMAIVKSNFTCVSMDFIADL